MWTVGLEFDGYGRNCPPEPVYVDAELAVSRLGPPLATELAHWVEPHQVDEMIVHYRALYPEHAVPASEVMPGATAALSAVRRRVAPP